MSAGAERKQATILFADIVDSTGLIAGLDAEDASRRLQPVVATMTRAVQRFNGVIIRTLGDGVKASFGAPQALENHALLACKAAIALREAVAGLPGAPTIRIGLHSGEVVTGEFDTGSIMERDTVGITVHLANRIEQLAEPGDTCLSRECRDLVRAYCDTVPLGARAAKGIREPLELYRLIGLKPAVASGQFGTMTLTRFQGRQAELALLKSAFAAAAQGETSVIGVVAMPGIGKSRLCFEFAEWCRRRRVEVLEARALAYAHATPLQMVLEMLRSFFRISPLDATGAARAAIIRRLHALDVASLVDLNFLADFLGVGERETSVAMRDPADRHARLRDIVFRLAKAAGRRPSVVIIDDLHWLDEPSKDFVNTMVDAFAGTRTLLVLNFRPNFRAGWMDCLHYREIALAELSADETHDLVETLTGDAPGLAALRSKIAERSNGNPFFAEELVRSLAHDGVLVGERGSYREGRSSAGASLPPTLEALLGARIDALEEDEKMLLQIGAIAGKEVPLAVLQAVTALPAQDVKGIVERLCRTGLSYEHPMPVGPGVAFRHPLTQEVAYAMQLRSRRTALHAAVAEALGRFEWGMRDDSAGILAYHCEAAGDRLGAAVHLQRAARWLGRTNSAEAFRTWKKIRDLLGDVPASEMGDKMRALASGQVLFYGWREGMSAEEAKALADEALRYARAGGADTHVALLLGGYGRSLAATGAADEYVAVEREVLALTSIANDALGKAAVNGMLTQAYYYAGRLNEALAANDAALAAIGEQQDTDQRIALDLTASEMWGFDIEHWIKCYRTLVLVRLGRFDEAEAWCARVTQIDPEHEDYIVQFIPHLAQVELAAWRGDAEAAERHAAIVVVCGEKSNSRYVQSCSRLATALARRTAGDLSGAAEILQSELDVVRRRHAGREFETWMLAELAETQLRGGNHVAAARTAAHAIEVARRRTHRVAEAHACITRARALRNAGTRLNGEDPEKLLQRAKSLIDLTGARIFDRLLTAAQSEVESARQ